VLTGSDLSVGAAVRRDGPFGRAMTASVASWTRSGRALTASGAAVGRSGTAFVASDYACSASDRSW